MVDSRIPESAHQLDQKFPSLRSEFEFPGTDALYFAGHSLGLMPRRTRELVNEELDAWSARGVEGHFEGQHPWLPYHEFVTPGLARLVGAKPSEVVAMNSLTVNLHLMLVSFYQPQKNKNKIIIEANTFPSDKYAVDSQARWHGLDPKQTVLEIPANLDTTDAVLNFLDQHRRETALVMLGNCNYLSGQKFDFQKITDFCHQNDIRAGFNLAHGAGNLHLHLHDWNVDFAVWCSYKYVNSGPGGIAGCFVHERHHQQAMPRLEGWWGQNKSTRFKMGPNFDPIPTVEAWQLSNPPILQLAALRASLELFDRAGMQALRERGDALTGFFEKTLLNRLGDQMKVITPKDRGSMLCLRFKKSPRSWMPKLREKHIFVDFREPDIIRATPTALYNSFADVEKLVTALEEVLE